MSQLKITAKGEKTGFIIRFLFFVFVFIVFDFCIGYLIRKEYFKQNSGWLYRTTYAMDSTKADLLIFGASRANHHYQISTLENKLRVSAYNTGRDGNAIFYHYAILKSILKRYHPKIAILDCSHGEFMKSKNSYERLSSLLPYYKTHPEIRPIVQLKSKYEQYKLFSSVYPYNSLLFQIAAGNSANNRNRQNRNDDNGYVPLYKSWNGSLTVDSSLNSYELDSLKIEYFNKFVTDCINAHIKLFICLSPCYLLFKNNDISVNIIQQIAHKYQIPIYDFSQKSVFLTFPSFYADESHLNDFGARLYTTMVAKEMLHDFPFLFKASDKSTASK